MATSSINRTGPTPITMSLASLPSSGSFILGRESTEIDETTNKYLNAMVEGFVTTGAVAPTINTYLKLYAWASHTAPSATPLDVITGLDAQRTFTSGDIQNSILKLVRSVKVSATVNQKYHFSPFTIADIFGEMPAYWGLFLANGTGQILSATGTDHEFKYTGIKFDSV